MARAIARLDASFCLPVINQLRPELWYKTHLLVPDLILLVPELRFNLPRTMITTRIADAREFFQRVRGSHALLASHPRLELQHRSRRRHPQTGCGIELMPLFLSEVVAGLAVTAYVVGREVEFDPPAGCADAADRCLAISAQLGLTFCAVN